MSKIQDTLMQSRPRVKLLKFLFYNNSQGFTAKEISIRIQEPTREVSKELHRLQKVGLIVKKRVSHD